MDPFKPGWHVPAVTVASTEAGVETPAYVKSNLLYKVMKTKRKGGATLLVDVGVVKINGRSLDDVNDILASKCGPNASYRAHEVWIGWTICGEPVTDGSLINKYGLLKDDLSDA